MSKVKDNWWAKLVSSSCLVLFTIIALSVGCMGIWVSKTEAGGVNLSLSGQAIYPQPVDQEVPEIYGTKVVWMQQGNDYYYKVFLGDLETGTSRQLGSSPAAEKYPAIWENKVIWMDYRSIMDDPMVQNKYAYIFKYYDMYGYDLEKNQEFPICTNPEWQGYGDIQKDRVVYADMRTGSPDIFLYDLRSGQEYAICIHPAWQGNPVIYDNYVIWMDERSGNYDIYGLDLATGKEFPICTAADNQAYPAISGTKVVWQDKRNGNDDIYLYDLATKQEIAICTHPGKQQVPDICGNIIVWQDDRNGNWDIYGYDLTTYQEFQITNQSGDETFPAISGDRIVWVDSRSGHKNIYAATLPSGFAPQANNQARNREPITASSLVSSIANTIAPNIEILKPETTIPAITSPIIEVPKTGPSIIGYENSGCKKEITSTTIRAPEEEKFTYKYQDNILYLFHENASYNCCIEEIAITMEVVGNTINIYEDERLEGSGCRCLCTYDLTTKIGCLEPGTYEVKFFNKQTGKLLGVIKEVVIPPIPCLFSAAAPVQKCCPLPCTDPINRCCPYASAVPEQRCVVCPVPWWPCPCSYFDDMEQDTWTFSRGISSSSSISKPLPPPPIQEIDYSTAQYVSPKRSIWAYVASYLETATDASITGAGYRTLEGGEKLDTASGTSASLAAAANARVSASRTFALCGCENLKFKLSYKIRYSITDRSLYRRVAVEVMAYDAAGNQMGKRTYVLFRNPIQVLSQEDIDIVLPAQSAWQTLARSLQEDIPIKWCEARKLQVILKAEGYFPAGQGDFVETFWDDLAIEGQNCNIILPCCPLAQAEVGAADALWCRPCPVASVDAASADALWCPPCPIASVEAASADALWCRPCPYEIHMPDGTIRRCCPVATTTAAGQALWCQPCPVASAEAASADALWCRPCPVATTTADGQALWCRPCPVATQLDNNLIRWCCPLAKAEVDSQSLWCWPCPYVVEKDAQLTRWCCPVAQNVDTQLWCRPCPYPKATDKELNIYCCPVATATAAGQAMWCRPCPVASDVADEAIKLWCCPLAQAEVGAADALWCRPCPVATATAANQALWCQPCPVPITPLPDNCLIGTVKEIQHHVSVGRSDLKVVDESGNIREISVPVTQAENLKVGDTVKVCIETDKNGEIISITIEKYDPNAQVVPPAQICCPLAQAEVGAADALWCRPCPVATTTAANQALWCRPCPIASVEAASADALWCRPCPVATTTAAGQALWCRPGVVTECLEEISGALDIESAQADVGDEVKIAIRIQNAPGAVSSFGFEVIYRSDILKYQGFERGNLVLSFPMIDVSPSGPDRLKVGGLSANPIPQGASGSVVVLKFKVIGGVKDECYPLSLENLVDNLAKFSKTGGCLCIKDTVPPQITCPGDRVIGQINSDGTPADDPEVVAFLAEAKAWDAVDGEVAVSATFQFDQTRGVTSTGEPVPGAEIIIDADDQAKIFSGNPLILPPGQTTVIFTARDKAGNSSSCTTTITIQPMVCEEDDSGQLDIKGTEGRIGEEVKIPIRIQNAPGAISALGFEVSYKPSVLEYVGFERGSLTASFSVFDVNPIASGRLIVGGYSTRGIPQGASGDLIILKFKVKDGMEGGCYPLKLDGLTDDVVNFTASPGCFCIKSCNGDQNGDGVITPADALIVFKCYLGSGPCGDCADVDGNGSVTPADALCLFKKYLGQPSCLDNLIKLNAQNKGTFAVSGKSDA